VGVFAGYFALGEIDNRQTAILIGVILLAMLALHVWRNWKRGAAKLEHEVETHAIWFAPLMGILAGFTTMVANAAGPVMVLYLLAMGLPKMEFLGTGAVFFMAVNLFKVPFMMDRLMITADSVRINVWLAPLVVAGALVGRAVAMRLPQKLFERIALALTFVAAMKLLIG
jgi:uncharacterized membrane protein YfcA